MISSFFKKVESAHNRAANARFVWFPFEFLKPLPNQSISLGRTVVMAVLFGIYFGIFFGVKKWVFGDLVDGRMMVETTGTAILTFLAWFNLVTAPLWNRRVRQLKNQEMDHEKCPRLSA